MKATQSSYSTETFLGHPKGFFILFLTEIWERFTFYGMRCLLVLFLVDKVQGGLGLDQNDALGFYGIYLTITYVLCVPGGAIADRWLGQKTATYLGGVLQIIGCLLVALTYTDLGFKAGLGVIALGTGFIKPSIFTMTGGLYSQGDTRLDTGFSIFYMGINIGALIAPLIVGYIAKKYGLRYGFGVSALGMFIGLIILIMGNRYLVSTSKCISKPGQPKKSTSFTGLSRADWDCIFVLIALFLAIGASFMIFKQAGGLINLYTENYTNRNVFGYEIPTTYFQSLNPAFIIILTPLMAWLFTKISRRYPRVSSIHKMGIGNIIVGLGFIVMMGAVLESQASACQLSSAHWLITAYLLQTIGEICLSPVALSFITKVAPENIKSSMMGLFFAIIGISGWYLASKVGQLSEGIGYLEVFRMIAIITIAIGLAFVLFNGLLLKLTHGREDNV